MIFNKIFEIFLEKKYKDKKTIQDILQKYETNIHNIVDITIHNTTKIKQTPDLDKYYKKNLQLIKHGALDKTVDEDQDEKFYKNYCTDIVTNHILDEDELYTFLYIINTLYTISIEKYIKKKSLKKDDIIFLFKGGNVFRIIANKFLNELPNKAMYKLMNTYMDFFKLSDFDFGIYINPALNNHSRIKSEITLISYKIQLLISNILFENKNACFKWFKYNEKYQDEILHKILKELNNTKPLKDKNSIFFENEFTNIQLWNSQLYDTNHTYKNKKNIYISKDKSTDFIIEYDTDETSTEYEIINNSTTNSFMYNTINTNLTKEQDEIGIEGNRTDFNLTRTKITFNLHIKNKIKNSSVLQLGGELIDVSIGSDHATEAFFKNKKKYMNSIQLKHHKNPELYFDINMFSLEYLYKDLNYILFETIEYPWLDHKYDKRLYRAFYLTFIDLFKNVKITPINNNDIQILYDYFSNINVYVKEFSKNDFKNKIKCKNLLKDTKQIDIFTLKCKRKMCLLNEFLKKCTKTIENVLNEEIKLSKKIDKNSHTRKLVKFISMIIKNINTLKIVNEHIINYSQTPIYFNYRNISTKLLI